MRSCWQRLRHPRGKSSFVPARAASAAVAAALRSASGPIRRAAAVAAFRCEPLEMRTLFAAYTLTDLGTLIGFGEIVIIEDTMGIRITDFRNDD